MYYFAWNAVGFGGGLPLLCLACCFSYSFFFASNVAFYSTFLDAREHVLFNFDVVCCRNSACVRHSFSMLDTSVFQCVLCGGRERTSCC